MGHGLFDEFEGIVDVAQRLLQVDDVDAVALGEDEALHLRVPTAGLMSEVNAAVEQLANGDDGHADALLSVHLEVLLRHARAGLCVPNPVRIRFGSTDGERR